MGSSTSTLQPAPTASAVTTHPRAPGGPPGVPYFDRTSGQWCGPVVGCRNDESVLCYAKYWSGAVPQGARWCVSPLISACAPCDTHLHSCVIMALFAIAVFVHDILALDGVYVGWVACSARCSCSPFHTFPCIAFMPGLRWLSLRRDCVAS